MIRDLHSSNFDASYATYDAYMAYGTYKLRTDSTASISNIECSTMPSGMPVPLQYSNNSWVGQGTKLHEWMLKDCTESGYSGYKNVEMLKEVFRYGSL